MNTRRERSFKVLGTGIGIPEKVLTNADLEKMVDTNDEWIRSRTGIHERHVADENTATSHLAATAINNACRDAGIDPYDLDMILVATSTPDTSFPSTACWVQKRLNISGMPAFDVGAGCTGWLYGLELAQHMVDSGRAKRVAVCGAEVMSKVLDWTDRSTCVLFGDGAGAVILGEGNGAQGSLASTWGADGREAHVLYQPAGGSQKPASAETVAAREHTVHMEGNTVFLHAVRAMSQASMEVLEKANVSAADVDLLIPHQANIRIMEATRNRTGIAEDRLYVNLHRYGNVSAATIPIALHEAKEEGRIVDGNLILLTAFGTGLTWAANLLRW